MNLRLSKRQLMLFGGVFLAFTVLAAMPSDFARAATVGFANNNLWFSATTGVIAGDNLKIYSNIINDSYDSFSGHLAFYDNGVVLGDPTAFTLSKEKSQLVNLNWVAVAGNHQFSAKIIGAFTIDGEGNKEFLSDEGLTVTAENFFVDQDSDNDGLGNQAEEDNGTNPLQADTDGDGYNDNEDNNPTDSQVFPGPDTDGDGISDLVDSDIDNDGLYNTEEEKLGTDPKKRDTDGDGVNDKEDLYPLDASKWKSEEIKEIPQKPTPPVSDSVPAVATKEIAEIKVSENLTEAETAMIESVDSNFNEAPLSVPPAVPNIAEPELEAELPRRSFLAATFGDPITAIPTALALLAAGGALIYSGLWIKAAHGVKIKK
jgi:hypothetical protein